MKTAKKNQSVTQRYSPQEERYNTYTHAAGILFGLIAGVILIPQAIKSGNGWAIGSVITYVIMTTLSYLTSTLYHANRNEKTKTFLRKLDHAAIYLNIAGTYTPFTLVVLRQESYWGWSLFATIWIAALIGILLSLRNLKNASKLELACYLAMGWVVAIAFKPLTDVLSTNQSMNVLYWLITGGGFYTLGAILYALKRIPYTHAIWHLFVLGGGISHAIAISLIKP